MSNDKMAVAAYAGEKVRWLFQQVAGFFRDVHVIMSCLTVDGNQKSGHHSPPGMVLKPVGK